MNIKKLEEIYDVMVEKVEQKLKNTENLEEIHRCGRVLKDVINMRVMLSENAEIFQDQNTENENAIPVLRTVYDIAIVEDILQRAKERFKDDLHLIEHHQNSIETIKKVNVFIEEFISQKKEKEGKDAYNGSVWSDSKLPEDDECTRIFLQKLKEGEGN